MLDEFVNAIYGGFDVENSIEPAMWQELTKIMNDATAKGLSKGEFSIDHNRSFLDAVKHANEVFAAFKTHAMGKSMASKLLDDNGNLKPFDKWMKDISSISSHHVGSWLKTEYNTAVLRAHNAADWRSFIENKDIMPNLRWMPTTSPDAEAVHRGYWEKKLTLPVEHSFWNKHHPGDRWNCKCSLESTDDPASPDDILDDLPIEPAQRGLENNPGKDGKMFNDTHPYFPKNCNQCSFYKNRGFKNKMKTWFSNHEKDCYNCNFINKELQYKDADFFRKRQYEYQQLKSNPEYRDVQFDKKTGGIKATHIGHITHEGARAERFFEGLTSSDLEKECMNQLFRNGHKVLFCNETLRRRGQQLPALDMELDGKIMDIRSVTGRGWYSNIFVSKNEQLYRYNNREDVTEKSDSLCMYFHDSSLYNEEKMRSSISMFKYRRDNDGNLLSRQLKNVYCVIKGNAKIKKFEI